jgi:hypothetical protein
MASQSHHGPVTAAARSAEQALGDAAKAVKEAKMTKQTEVVMFSSSAIALYGCELCTTRCSTGFAYLRADDQGMMALVNTNYNYLRTMGIGLESPMVAVIVSVRLKTAKAMDP